MTMMHSIRSLVLAIVVMALAVGACGGSDDSALPTGDFDSSPINDLLGVDVAMRSGDLVELERAAERGVVECMAQAGFEYRPVDFAAQLGGSDGPSDPDSREFAQAYGYGIVAAPEQAQVDPTDFVDPNDEIRATLTPAELDAYQLALYGDAPVEGEQIALDDRTGCVASAYRQVYDAEDDMARVEDFFTEFGQQFNEIEQRFRADPRYVELQQQWSNCMTDAGYAFDTRDAIFLELNDRMNATGPIETDASTADALEEVAEWERAVAATDWDCTQGVDEELRRLRYRYEAAFIEENEGLLGDS